MGEKPLNVSAITGAIRKAVSGFSGSRCAEQSPKGTPQRQPVISSSACLLPHVDRVVSPHNPPSHPNLDTTLFNVSFPRCSRLPPTRCVARCAHYHHLCWRSSHSDAATKSLYVYAYSHPRYCRRPSCWRLARFGCRRCVDLLGKVSRKKATKGLYHYLCFIPAPEFDTSIRSNRAFAPR